ncbi:MAG: glycerol-3-phosphate dehydrogenase/oxidase [Burkholderiaceae bacterium]|nr:glycerol-3-phosphate dehydrogenase/oxidase [Burkholderiaceae bacterium]MDH5207768.1 glycerol-3-phosphate dehydrogenase/oxidase [Burkholderiaceae bacterium]
MAARRRPGAALGRMTGPGVIKRAQLISQLRDATPWDVLVIGGGATGLGIALDAAARGYRTALIEARDFASGTSSRSTKLVHGGVRYLAQGNVKLVREALAERALLLANAPELVHPLEFVVPCYRPLEREVMRIGLGLYDALAGHRGVGATRWLSREATLAQLPGVRAEGLRGGVAYWDGQFDDARLAIALMRTAVGLGATVVNYVRVESIDAGEDRIRQVVAVDEETGERLELRAKAVFNATGVWVDAVRRLADPDAHQLVTISRGSHIVLDHRFLPGERGLMIPKTADGRVLFGIPWHGRLIVGTTDVPVDGPAWDPRPAESEIEFILETARGYLATRPSRGDVLAAFAGLRPLFSPGAHGATRTISREHAIVIEHGNLLTVTGGKWTTYRRMALDALAQATRKGLLDARPCTTESLRLSVDPALERAHRVAEEIAARGETRGIESYLQASVSREQARRPDDLLVRRLRAGLLQEGLLERLRPAAAAALATK